MGRAGVEFAVLVRSSGCALEARRDLDLYMPKGKTGVIYMAVGPTGKKYVGQTTWTCEKRWKAHVNEAMANARAGCRALNRAIRKHGAESFVVTVLESGIALENLDAREIHHIAEQKSFGKGGYNMTSGGEGATELCQETLELMGRQKQAQWQDQETRKRLQRCHSAEAIQKHVDLCKQRREQRAQGMTEQEVQRMEVRYQKGQKKRFRDLEMRQAMRDPEKRVAWLKENARMTPDDRKRQEMFKQRMERVAGMSYLDGQEYLLKLKTSAIGTAKRTGASLEHIERWYPNVLTGREIAELRKNNGVWPSSAPGPRASSAKNKGKRKQTSEASGSIATSVPRSRPSCASEENHMSYLATSDDEGYGSR